MAYTHKLSGGNTYLLCGFLWARANNFGKQSPHNGRHASKAQSHTHAHTFVLVCVFIKDIYYITLNDAVCAYVYFRLIRCCKLWAEQSHICPSQFWWLNIFLVFSWLLVMSFLNCGMRSLLNLIYFIWRINLLVSNNWLLESTNQSPQ